VHFLLQSVPTYSPTKITRTIKSISARDIFAQAPGVKRALLGGVFWGSGFISILLEDIVMNGYGYHKLRE